MSSYRKATAKRGFTLIEILVVLAIIGILSVVSNALLNDARKAARDTQRITDLEQMRLALRVYRDTYGFYPDCRDGVLIGVGEDESNTIESGDNCLDRNMNQILSPYFSHVPSDPLGPGNSEYKYVYDSDHECGDQNDPTHNVVLYATKAEKAYNQNWHTPHGIDQGVCGNNGGLPDFETYGVIVN